MCSAIGEWAGINRAALENFKTPLGVPFGVFEILDFSA
jgi:hypothetical protein